MTRSLRLVFTLLLLAGCESGPEWQNSDLPIDRRVDDLVGRMTLEEKVMQMNDQAPAIERLGIPEYNWWNEALHGYARSGLATSFPQAIGLAATWDEDAIFRMATIISHEARAKHHEYVRQGSRLRYQGLTIWSPNINIFRDPRWGRGQETYGEDPYLTGRIAVPFIRGLQGDDPDYLKTVATVKHFAVHSGPEPDRHTFDAVVSERDLHETYLPQFEVGIREAGAYSLMCAYNRLYGVPACGSDLLLQDILRGEWKFDGYVVSDCWAISDFYEHHKVVETPEEASAMAVKSGTDLDCGTEAFPSLVAAVEQGLISESAIDTAVKRLFRARFRLGMFDPVDRVAYQRIPYSVVDQPSHRELARELTRKSIVLLKNDGVLPLAKDLGSIAVIGPNADQWLMLLGNYNGTPADPVTPLRGIREAVSPDTKVTFARGSDPADGFPVFEVVPATSLRTSDGAPGLVAEIFDNRERDGAPATSETVETLDADWMDGAPTAEMNADDFGVRWTGVLRPEKSGTYQLGLMSTMAVEMSFADSVVIASRYNFRNEFGDPRLIPTAPVELEAGREYPFAVNASESYGEARVQLLWAPPSDGLLTEAVSAAREADAVVMFLGLTPRLEGEEMRVEVEGFAGGDRTDLVLPAAQRRLLEAVVLTGKPTVLVLLNGSALAVNWADRNVGAIVEAWYPGQAAGTAIADVLFGDYNPAGRLPVTFYRSVGDLPPFDDYAMEGRTYRYFEGEPLYAFGHGLSYTNFGYENLKFDRESLSQSDSVVVSVDVTNTGARSGEEVVQLYVRRPESAISRPNRDLRGFRRVALEPSETMTVTMTLKADALRHWDPDTHAWALEPGPVLVQVGASSADLRVEGTILLTE